MGEIFYSKQVDGRFLAQLKEELSVRFKDCKKIAVKMHFGEAGNLRAFTPKDIKPITDLLESMGFEYFLFDSSVMYGGPRANPKTHRLLALAKGFRHVETGDEFVEVKGAHLTYQVCSKLSEADAVLVLSHVKGHVCAGFGGAIKNLGMGALTKKSKTDIHEGGKPVFSGVCNGCGTCVRGCPIDGLGIETDELYPVVKDCYGCSNCSYVCPQKVIHPKVAPFDVLLAEGANAAQSKFKKCYYVSAIRNITKNCDCVPLPGDFIAEDIGWIMGGDGVAADQAAYDLIIKKSGQVFLKNNKKLGVEQINAAEKIGMGKREYVLKEL
jgi:uncharacterized Fe-S center protein